MLTGTVLIATIALGRLRGRAKIEASILSVPDESDTMKNSQLAVLCAAVIAGSLIVAATNVWLVHWLKTGAPDSGAGAASGSAPGRGPSAR